MSKLYPPIIESRLPAFSLTGGKGLTIPYRQNPAVGANEVDGFICLIKTLGGTEKGRLYSQTKPNLTNNLGTVTFTWHKPSTAENNDKIKKRFDDSAVLLASSPLKASGSVPDTAHDTSEYILGHPNYQLEVNRIYNDVNDTNALGNEQSLDYIPTSGYDPAIIELIKSEYIPQDSAFLDASPGVLAVEDSSPTGGTALIGDTSQEDYDNYKNIPIGIRGNAILINNKQNYTNIIDELNGQTIYNTEGNFNLQYDQFYKIQLAYYQGDATNLDNLSIGYFSDVAIIKCVNLPKAIIENLSINQINIMNNKFIGVVNNLYGTDRLYSYRFVVETVKLNTEHEHQIVYDTGEILYTDFDDKIYINSDNIQLRSSRVELIYNQDLEYMHKYYVTFYATTTTGIKVESPSYLFKAGYAIPLKFHTRYTRLLAEPLVNSGGVKLSLTTEHEAIDTNTGEKVITKDTTLYNGKFRILRSDSHSKYKTWDEIFSFELHGEHLDRALFNDFTIEQNTGYRYALQQYNQKLVSNKLLSKIIHIDYEDIYLSDEDHLLRVCFNPNISTFKPTILESKLETIGSKYPYMFRNGIVNYKEFAITGLISYLMDSDNVFLPYEESIFQFVEKEPRTNTRSKIGVKPPEEFDTNKDSINLVLTDLTGQNIQYERDFKLKVLNWLTNGQPKLLRTPTEGNYIVRLTGVSLSPQAALGRMLHSFSCTAYEIDEVNFANLQKYHLLRIKSITPPEEIELISDQFVFDEHDCKGLINQTDFQAYSDEQVGETNYPITAIHIPTQSELLAAMRDDGGWINGWANQVPQNLTNVRFEGFIPGSYIGLTMISSTTGETYKVPILIGLSGSYNVLTTDKISLVYPLWVPPKRVWKINEKINSKVSKFGALGYYTYEAQSFKGTMYYSYKPYLVDNTFNLIDSVTLSEDFIQVTGLPRNLTAAETPDLKYPRYYFNVKNQLDLFEFYQLHNLLTNVAYIHSMHFRARDILDCYLIPAQDLLPYDWDETKNDFIQVNRQGQVFLCRTATAVPYNSPRTYDGKIPLLVSELLDRTIYRCHYYKDGHEQVKDFDGWLLKLALDNQHRNIPEWDFIHYKSDSLIQKSLYDYDYVYFNNLQWMTTCEIPNDNFNAQITIVVDGEASDPITFNYNNNLTITVKTVSAEDEQVLAKTKLTIAQVQINRDSNGYSFFDYPIGTTCEIALGANVQADASLTVAHLTYQFPASAAADTWARILSWFSAALKKYQQNFANSNSSLDRAYWDYQMRHICQIYLDYLNWFLIEASTVDQPLMIPPMPSYNYFDNAGVSLPQLNYWRTLEYLYADSESFPLENEEPKYDQNNLIFADKLYNYIIKDIKAAEISAAAPGIYRAAEPIFNLVGYTDKNGQLITSVEQNGLIIIPNKSALLLEMSPELLAIESSTSNIENQLMTNDLYSAKSLKDLVAKEELSIPLEYGYYKVTNDLTENELLKLTIDGKSLAQVMQDNNLVTLHKNTILQVIPPLYSNGIIINPTTGVNNQG